MDERIQELLDLAEEEGIDLPMSPEWIVLFEDAGGVVDLTTGRVEAIDTDSSPE
jgi:hypothetical protein